MTAQPTTTLAPFRIERDVTPQRIADMFTGAVEGGSGYWCSGIYLKSPGDVAPGDEFRDEVWYANPHRYEDPDLKIELFEFDSEADKKHIVTLDNIKRGLALMAEKSPHQFANLVGETDDATTADVFLQYVVFGEVVYG